SMAALRDAGWIVGVDVAAAFVFATFAVAGPRLLAPAAPIRALRSEPALAPDMSQGSLSALSGAALGVLLVIPFAVLFWTADAAFAELGRSVPVPSVAGLPARCFVFLFVLTATLGLAVATRTSFVDPAAPTLRAGRLHWAIPLALLDLLFLAFVAVQITVLFGGHDHVLRTSGLTYSEYVRQGVWQRHPAATLTVA